MNTRQTLSELERRAEAGGGEERQRRQHAAGKLTARERMEHFFDAGTFEETDKLVTHRCQDFGRADELVPGDGVVAVHRLADGQPVYTFAQDFTVFGGSLSETNAAKIVKVMDLAVKMGAPVVGLNDSGGARIQEGVVSLGGYADIFTSQHARVGCHSSDLRHHGTVRWRCGVLAGHHGFHDHGPEHELHVGDGSRRHQGRDARGSHEGRARRRDDAQCDERRRSFRGRGRPRVPPFIRELLGYLPSNNLDDPPRQASADPRDREDEALDRLVPDMTNQPYDMRDLIQSVADSGEFLEAHRHFARNIIVGFARLDGRSVGIVANQPAHLAGVLDIDASLKAARFVRFCDAFNIPLITFEDVPGFLPGTQQEHGGIIKHGAKLLFAFAEATVPKVTVITRKAYGGAYCVMASKHIRTDLNYAWPTAEIAVMGPEGAVNILHKILHKRELEAATDPAALRAQRLAEFREKFATPFVAAGRGFVDEVVQPRTTRPKLIAALARLDAKRDTNPPKKHGYIPL